VSRGPFDGSHAPSPLRTALGRFTTGVTIVTCSDAAGVAAGLTVNSFSALSLEPPLVLWSLRIESPSLPSFRAARHFAVNVLAEHQLDLSRRFATGSTHKFDAGRWSAGHTGAPVLAGALAVLECAMESAHEHGDHVLFIGAVRHFAAYAGAPLLFQAGRYRSLGDLL
jgi:flavin reductase (DIM6/NTAB) family NADH-FMN oxidoreductase RutF